MCVCCICDKHAIILFFNLMTLMSSVAGDRLMHLTSRDGDWFLDELCTMCGNISQLLSVLKNNPLKQSTFKANQTDSMDGILCSMQVVCSAVKAYNSLQELMSNFRSIIVPEAVNLFSIMTLLCCMLQKPSIKLFK